MAEMKDVDKFVATAMKTLEQSCQAGDGESCYDFGRFLLRGDPAKGVNPDVKKAAKVLRAGCDFEHAKSCQVLCSLNQVYLLTRNYKIADIDNPYLAQFVDFERVREWKRKSFSWTIRKKVQPICQKADQLMDDLCLKGNDDEVCSRQGAKYLMQDDRGLSKAETLLKHGCFKLKDPNSCLSLSHLYSFSNQMFTNGLNSATYLRLACEAPFDEKDKRKQSGAAEACLLLAKRKEVDYLRSENMSDRTELLKHQYHYFRRGCDLLNARSCIGLGLLFLRIPGHSVASTTIDGLNASPYNTRNTSAVINEPLSSTVAHNLSPSEIQEREIGAIRSFQSACNNCGEKLGCYLAGLMLSTDRGLSEKDKRGDTPESLEIIRENLEDARDYLQLACDKGEQLACQNLDPTVSRLETTITKLYRMLDNDADARKPW